MPLNNYKVFSYSDENKKSYNLNFDCIVNKDDDCDVNFAIKLNHEIYISEFDKKISLDSFVILSSKNNDNNKIELKYNLIDNKNVNKNIDSVKDLADNISIADNTLVIDNTSYKDNISESNSDINNIINNLINHIDTFKNKFKIDNETIFDSLQDIKEIIEEEKRKEKFTPLEIFLLDAIKNKNKEIIKKYDPEPGSLKPLLKLNKKLNKKFEIEDDENEYEIQEDDDIENKVENNVKINTYVQDINTKYIELNKEKNEIQDTLLKLAEEEKNKYINNNDNNDINDNDLNEFITIENKIYNHLKLILSSKSINANNIIYIVTELMKFIEIFRIKGVDKKTIILATLRKFLTDENYTPEQIDFIINIICKELIDILISIDKRKIIIRKNFSCFIPWCN
jgi:hypothetical protein